MSGWLEGEYVAYLFERDDTVIGYALYRPDDDCIYIRQFFIRPESRRHGHGRFAIDWLVNHVWTAQRSLRLDVLDGNHAGIAFWRSLGFADYCITMERTIRRPECENGDDECQ